MSSISEVEADGVGSGEEMGKDSSGESRVHSVQDYERHGGENEGSGKEERAKQSESRRSTCTLE